MTSISNDAHSLSALTNRPDSFPGYSINLRATGIELPRDNLAIHQPDDLPFNRLSLSQ